jgi:Arginase family
MTPIENQDAPRPTVRSSTSALPFAPSGRLALMGAPSGAGACGVGQEQAPIALRSAGLIEQLADAGFEVEDLGDSQVVPWRPDRARPQAQNLDVVVDVVRTTASRVAAALQERDRTVLVLGGDCTVGIGTIAGIRAATMQCGEGCRGLFVSVVVRRGEHPCRTGSRPRQHSFSVGRIGQNGFEELPDRPEGELPLERTALCGQHTEALCRRARPAAR